MPGAAKPVDVFDRDQEWSELVRFATVPGSGLRLGVVYGRRRQGKSFLLRRLATATGGLYHQALEEERRPALDRLGADLARHLGLPAGHLHLADWVEAVNALARLGSKGKPSVVVIDELPYLLAHSPELPSVLQKAIDDSRSDSPVRFIACGSALAVMSRLLSGPQALRGRATLELLVHPFDYRQTQGFWEISDPMVAFHVHAILGGTPGYRDLIDAPAPRSLTALARWLGRGVLNPASALFREDDYLLSEERSMSDRAIYHSVLNAIARGASTEGRIASALGRDQRSIQHQLRALERAGFVVRQDDVLRDRRPVYRLADPIIRFHHLITRADLSRFEERRTQEAWIDAFPRLAAGILGPHFEEISRQFVRRFASVETTGGRIATVGAAVVNDAKGRAQHEIDIVALGPPGAARRKVKLLGEAKFSARQLTLSDLGRLIAIRDLLSARGLDTGGTKLALFSASGFDQSLKREPGPIELVDLDRLYAGE